MFSISASPSLWNRTLFRGALAVAILIVIVTALATSAHLRQLAHTRTAVTAQNMAKSIEQTIEGMINTIDVTLLASADEISRQMAAGKVDVAAVTGFLGRQLKRVPDLSYLRATNEHGDVVFGTGVLSPPNTISDRDYFIFLRDTPDTNVLVSRHLVGRIANQWAWLFARRIYKSDGTFGGVVFAGILTDRIETLFSRFQLDSGSSISLRDAELGVLARYTTDIIDAIPPGDKRLSLPFVAALKANRMEGNYVSGATSIDGINRFHAYRQNAKYDFLINVGSTGEDALTEWRKQTVVVIGLATAFICVSLVFALLIGRAWRRQEHDMVLLSNSQKELHEAEKIANLGRYSYDLISNRWTSSDILDGIFGISSDFPRDAEHWLSLIAEDDRQEMQDYLKTIIEQRQAFDHEYRIICANSGEIRWVHGMGRLQFDDRGNPARLLGTIQDITKRKQMEEQVRNLAFYDPLTKLANRRLLNDRLGQAMVASKRSKSFGALLFLDLDNFKPLNDTYGHEVGDLLLLEAADRLRNCVRETDTVARFGGDEFVVVIGELDMDLVEARAQSGAIAEKIRAALDEPYMLNIEHGGIVKKTIHFHCTTSIGVVVFVDIEESQEEILKWADHAMYQAKEAGRNSIRFYDSNGRMAAKDTP